MYHKYFMAHVTPDLRLEAGMLDKATLFTRDPNDATDYAKPDISAMWFGWKTCLQWGLSGT